jgi:asparagine synthase (glutamine-hydrolysing)
MMHSIEARVPFQDDALVDQFVWTHPRANLGTGLGKQLLRSAFADRLPREVLDRRKRPFQAPGAALVREGLQRALPELLARHRLQSYGALDPSATEAVVSRALAAGEQRSFEVWTLIALQFWCEAFLVPSPAAAGVGGSA